MISVSLMGGLGNQMFQYAAGRTLARRWNESLLLDTSWFDSDFASHDLTPRHLAITDFCIRGELRSAPVASARIDRVRARVRRELVIADHRCTPTRFARLPHLRSTHLVGYWQDRRYFEEAAEVIRQEFQLKSQPSAHAQSILDILGTSGGVAVHVRRGDYVTRPSAAQHHGALEADYYLRAVEHIRSRAVNDPVYIFSDDPEWCSLHLRDPLGGTIVSGSLPDTEELIVMATCRHHVISHSSFSWWAAWLGQHADQSVIAPRRWTTDGKPPVAPPEHWTLL